MTDRALRCIVLGAAGRDFHDVQTFFRSHPAFQVVAITAAQIPYIASRAFPRELAGPTYTADIPIVDEERLPELIREHDVDFVFLSYSDLSHLEVMHKASIVEAAGASFALDASGFTSVSPRVRGSRNTCSTASCPSGGPTSTGAAGVRRRSRPSPREIHEDSSLGA